MKPYERLIKTGAVEIEALCFIRGRSIARRFFILDEAQQLTPHEVKTIITRISEGSKIVLIGDPTQIDNPYVDARSNGLVYCHNRMRGQPIAAHIKLTKGERSKLAELAADCSDRSLSDFGLHAPSPDGVRHLEQNGDVSSGAITGDIRFPDTDVSGFQKCLLKTPCLVVPWPNIRARLLLLPRPSVRAVSFTFRLRSRFSSGRIVGCSLVFLPCTTAISTIPPKNT